MVYRGADSKAAGSPPRVRSRRSWPGTPDSTAGITSACAEQTVNECLVRVTGGDHLRVCGADLSRFAGLRSQTGSPPRVRSRLGEVIGADRQAGITSACAEQTQARLPSSYGCRDHLRVCGADITAVRTGLSGMGSPPRVRSRLLRSHGRSHPPRITSACAEQTNVRDSINPVSKDHLRVCGADHVPERTPVD